MRAQLALGSLVVAASCTPIEPRPISTAPINACPCEGFEPGTTRAVCVAETGRCEFTDRGGRPAFPFWIVVHVPETSTISGGLTYVMVADANGNPTFNTTSTVSRLCPRPTCLTLSGVADVQGGYNVTEDASRDLGFPLADGTSVPVRVTYETIGNDQQDALPSLPLTTLSASSFRDARSSITFSRALPSARYRRTLFPQAPFDAVFPPVSDELEIFASGTGLVADQIILGGDHRIDDPAVSKREAVITRAEGLDGWQSWLAERSSQRRVSVLRTLSGTESTVTLHTALGAVSADVDLDVIVAPPASWIGVPRLVSFLPGGQGLRVLDYPTIPPPASVAGVVAVDAPGGGLVGFPATVSFQTANAESKLLQYAATVDTDEKGRFATTLPRGSYVATIEPAEGTGFAKAQITAEVDRERAALVFKPPRRTTITGRAVLTDGRALAEADILALPEQSATELITPRAGRSTSDADGRFSIALDQGNYVFSVVPKPGTGFPRVVVRYQVLATSTELPEIRVPPPSRLAFELRAFDASVPIARALVRVFAVPGGSNDATTSAAPVEIGTAISDDSGNVEILLAQEPR